MNVVTDAKKSIVPRLPGSLVTIAGLLAFVLMMSVPTGGQTIPGYTDVIEDMFQGDLSDLSVNGDVKLESKTDLKLTMKVEARKKDGFGLDATFSLNDDKCDYQNIKTTFSVDIVWPPSVKKTIDTACNWGLRTPLCNAGGRTQVISEARTLSLLGSNRETLKSLTLSTKDTANVASKSVTDYVGGDLELKILHPNLMVAGLNFSVFLTAKIFEPSSPVCQLSLLQSLCQSNAIDLTDINLGQQLSNWIVAQGNNQPSWIDKDDGTIVIGRNSLTCIASPGTFSFGVDGKDLQTIDIPDLADLRDRLVSTANNCMPSGYTVNTKYLKNLTIISDGNGGYTVNGLVYSGGAKDPAGVIQALRECIAKEGGFMNVANGKTIIIEQLEGGTKCSTVREKDNMCNTRSPPSSAMRDDKVAIDGNEKVHPRNAGMVAIVGMLVFVGIAGAYFITRKVHQAKRRIGSPSEENNSGEDFSIIMMETRTEDNLPVAMAVSGGTSWEDIAIADKNARRSLAMSSAGCVDSGLVALPKKSGL